MLRAVLRVTSCAHVRVLCSAVVHSQTGLTRAQSVAAVYVNGVLASSRSEVGRRASYPHFDAGAGSGIRCIVGNAEVEYVTSSEIRVRAAEGLYQFFGRLGAVYLLDAACDAGQVAGMHALGPDYILAFERPVGIGTDRATDALRYLGAAVADTDLKGRATDGILAAHVLVAVNPSVWVGRLFVNNATRRMRVDGPSVLRGVRVDGVHVRRLHGTYASVTRRSLEVLQCLGGVYVLLPLFAAIAGGLGGAHDGEVVERVVRLMSAVTIRERGLQREAANESPRGRFHIAGVVAYLVRALPVAYITPRAVNAVFDLALELDADSADDGGMALSILANPVLWAPTAVGTGGAAFEALVVRVCALGAKPSDAPRLRRAIPPGRLIECLHTSLGYGVSSVVGGCALVQCVGPITLLTVLSIVQASS